MGKLDQYAEKDRYDELYSTKNENQSYINSYGIIIFRYMYTSILFFIMRIMISFGEISYLFVSLFQ
jgi:hypothetical protein